MADLIKENEALKQRLACLEQNLSAANEKVAELENKPAGLATIKKQMVMPTKKTVKFYTGFVSAAIFSAFLQLVLSVWEACAVCLDPDAQLILVFMRLRLGLLTQDVACRFGVSNSKLIDIFNAWLDVLATSMTRFIVWPSRRTLDANRPPAFQDTLFAGLAGIIDCTEVFIQRPTLMIARSQTYSNYKYHNTVKLLVVISPSGAITFVSKAWGGRTSDKEVTLRSGLLEKVTQGDVFLVDR